MASQTESKTNLVTAINQCQNNEFKVKDFEIVYAKELENYTHHPDWQSAAADEQEVPFGNSTSSSPLRSSNPTLYHLRYRGLLRKEKKHVEASDERMLGVALPPCLGNPSTKSCKFLTPIT